MEIILFYRIDPGEHSEKSKLFFLRHNPSLSWASYHIYLENYRDVLMNKASWICDNFLEHIMEVKLPQPNVGNKLKQTDFLCVTTKARPIWNLIHEEEQRHK